MASGSRDAEPWASVPPSVSCGVPSRTWLPEAFGTRLVSLASARLKGDTSPEIVSKSHEQGTQEMWTRIEYTET